MKYGVRKRLKIQKSCINQNKLKLLGFSIAFFIFQSTYCQLNIGNKLHKEISLDSTISIFVTPAELRDGFAIKYNGIKYDICIDKDSILTYIETRDKLFLTEDGVSIGTKYSEALKSVKSKPHVRRGFGCIMPLKSGWNTGFLLQRDTNNIVKDSTVCWIFKIK